MDRVRREQARAPQEFCDSLTDAQRDDVMKIVPRMVEGPWVAKHAVGQKPALLGHAITTAYHRYNWFYGNIDICYDYVFRNWKNKKYWE